MTLETKITHPVKLSIPLFVVYQVTVKVEYSLVTWDRRDGRRLMSWSPGETMDGRAGKDQSVTGKIFVEIQVYTVQCI